MSLATSAYRSAVKSTGSVNISQIVSKVHGFNIDFSETEQEFVYRERRLMAREIFQQMKIFNDAFQNALDYEFYKEDLHTDLAREMHSNLAKIRSQIPFPAVYCQGGYYRDFFAGIKNFNDIDLKFPSIEFAELFQKHCISLPCEVKTSASGYSSGCISLELTHKDFNHIKLPVDLGYLNDRDYFPQYFDMDVNMLTSTLDVDDPEFMNSLQIANPDCDLETAIEHCMNRSFVVFSKHGKSILTHEHPPITAKYNEEGLITGLQYDMHTYGIHDCIYFDSRARKLRTRIEKMQERGWIRLNTDCQNPMCVLASAKLVGDLQAYYEREKEQKRKEKLSKLKRREQRLQESILMSMSRIPGYIPRKTVNRMSHESRVKGHQKDLLRKERVKVKKQFLDRFKEKKTRKHIRFE
ncbi:hypothetical protein H012_gp890 [Acanthamoeba polyphaga moumouvirus]|uniref:Uncharacterized protein n=1 Tax=Acanthamoeba polyphaga moumouvirus TaxID=1269028 RepID=L7RBR9_9VIRU|nr:hypothetical protein H012_gp890 [Acanthamoeba polyphaga moumouvirus]AGC01576.1 hypothetical protein Moumou_00028 [Acanthamoeba polyphaga moumouvirus]